MDWVEYKKIFNNFISLIDHSSRLNQPNLNLLYVEKKNIFNILPVNYDSF